MLVYLLLINAFALFLMHRDKARARKKQWRIPEKLLILVAFIGGSLGILLGMCAFRHKTKHPKFSVGVPVMMMVQTVLGVLYLIK